jgi:hypothetical protein
VGGSGPGGAVLLGTDDEAAMQSALDRLAGRLAPKLLGSASHSVAVTSSGHVIVRHHRVTVHWATVTDNGVTIRYATDPLGSSGIRPAYAVSDGMGIVATSPEAVQAVLDTKAGGPSIANAPTFVLASRHAGSTKGDVVYLDFWTLADLIGSGGAESGDLHALRSLIVTDHHSVGPDHGTGIPLHRVAANDPVGSPSR